tara:strand:+ start:3357 stop:4055 length:699 start_codon:yes stop_codon:yes gene_type:complete
MEKSDWKFLDDWSSGRNEWSRPKYSFFLLMLFLLLGALPYGLINRFSAWRGTSSMKVEIPLDWDLPFVPWMVIPYYSFYLYFPIAAWVGSSAKFRHRGLIFHQRMIVAAWVAFAMFLIFPVEIELRSQAQGAEGLFGFLMTALHEADTPYNAWPSIHVLLSILVVMFVRYVGLEEGTWNKPLAVVVWISCALLVASTALIKQHYVFDGVSGTALAFGLWYGYIQPGLNRTAH